MQGIDATNGKPLEGIAHLRQSIRNILTTPIGSRVMRRDYGSDLFKLIDAPVNRSTLMDIYAATAKAISRWEPRFNLESCKIVSAEPGRVELDLVGEYLPDGKKITLDGIEVK
jgi:phage baseplate assembly protein W